MADKSIVQKVVLAAIVFNKEEKVLVLQRNTDEEVFPNMWELPSGKREPLEDSLQSLKREVLEETNIDIQVKFWCSPLILIFSPLALVRKLIWVVSRISVGFSIW